jgi:hypothetical protein
VPGPAKDAVTDFALLIVTEQVTDVVVHPPDQL